MLLHKGKAMWGHSKKVAIWKSGRESSPETRFAGNYTLHSQPPELCKNKCLMFKPPGSWYFIMAAQANYYSAQGKNKHWKECVWFRHCWEGVCSLQGCSRPELVHIWWLRLAVWKRPGRMPVNSPGSCLWSWRRGFVFKLGGNWLGHLHNWLESHHAKPLGSQLGCLWISWSREWCF